MEIKIKTGECVIVKGHTIYREGVRKYMCKSCNMVFGSKLEMEDHIWIDGSSTIKYKLIGISASKNDPDFELIKKYL